MSEGVNTLPVLKPLFDEYERQKVLCAEASEQYIARLQAFAEEHPDLAHHARRLLSEHMGWV